MVMEMNELVEIITTEIAMHLFYSLLFHICLSGFLPDEWQEEIVEGSPVHRDIVKQLPQSNVGVVGCSISSDRPGYPVPLVG